MPAAVAIPLITAAVGAGATVAASRSASGSARRASNVTAQANRAAEEDARAQRDEERRQFEITEANRQREFAAAEEERAYRRQQDEYNRKLQEEREARQAPYRQMSAAALGNLGQILGIDLGSTPLANNLTAPRTTGGPGAAMPPSRAPGRPPSIPREWEQTGNMDGSGSVWLPPGSRTLAPLRDPRLDPRRGLPVSRTLGDVTGMR